MLDSLGFGAGVLFSVCEYRICGSRLLAAFGTESCASIFGILSCGLCVNSEFLQKLICSSETAQLVPFGFSASFFVTIPCSH